jgi:hypothetical protein
MGNSCACIKDKEANEFENIQSTFKGNNIDQIVRIQSNIRGFLARK